MRTLKTLMLPSDEVSKSRETTTKTKRIYRPYNTHNYFIGYRKSNLLSKFSHREILTRLPFTHIPRTAILFESAVNAPAYKASILNGCPFFEEYSDLYAEIYAQEELELCIEANTI